MGYSHFFGPKPGEPASSQSKTDAGSNKNSSEAPAGRGIQDGVGRRIEHTGFDLDPRISPSQEADDLKQQIKNLNQKIDRLGERVDRLQQLLSLAVPLLQRIAPKD